ncbi:MAG: histidine phosphatase family protein [Ruminococcaceae bacterium]|nr:histidine phosphatase family protein [Oscillospiraceae bacterium]
MTIYLFRHGRTAYNDEKRYQGQRDIPLSDVGARELAKAPFDAEIVYVSPLSRARMSAEILFPGACQIAVPGLMEFDFGAFEGRNYMDMSDDADYRAWVEGGCEIRCPGGESRAEFCARTCAAFAPLVEAAAERGEEQLVIVAHSGTLHAVMEGFALPEKGYFDWEPPCGGGYALDFDAALWRERKKLRYRETLRCTKDGALC